MSGRLGIYSQAAGGELPFAFGNALEFDGVNDYVSFGGSNILADPTGTWSVGGWVKLDSFSPTFQALFTLKSGTTNDPFWCAITNVGAYNDLNFGSRAVFPRKRVALGTFIGIWKHIVINYNAGVYSIYIDSVLTSQSNSSAYPAAIDSSYLGTYSAGVSNFNGLEDEFSFWQQELTPAQIATQYNGGLGNNADIDVTPLVWFKLNESGTATTAVNSGSGGVTYDGTLNNFPASGMWVAH